VSWTDLITPQTYILALQKMIYIPVSIFSAYVSGYFLLPRFILKGRYIGLISLLISLVLVDLLFARLLTRLLVASTSPLPYNSILKSVRLFQPIIYGAGLGLATSGFAIIVKLLKYHYLKQKENENLQQQKINRELKIIKTNFLPHFLSDALKNIAKLIRSGSKLSPIVILKISDLLSYILYYCEKESVTACQELQMVTTYLELEKIFYEERVNISIDERGDADNLRMAPLILLPFVQNTCEQLLISLQQKLVLDISVRIAGTTLFFFIRFNGYYDRINGTLNPGSALSSSLKRIEALYGRDVVKTNLEDEFFSFEIELDEETLLTNQNLYK
jgi:sensor histidine kinase YesM